MKFQRIVIARDINMPVEQAFERIADHDSLGKIVGLPVRRIRDGRTEPNGLDSVRAVRIGPLRVEETVVGFRRNDSIDYRITRNSGPLDNHHGRVEFTARAGGGSRVIWRITFTAWPLVGPLVAGLLRLALRRALRRL